MGQRHVCVNGGGNMGGMGALNAACTEHGGKVGQGNSLATSVLVISVIVIIIDILVSRSTALQPHELAF